MDASAQWAVPWVPCNPPQQRPRVAYMLMSRVVAGNMGDVPGLAARCLAPMPCAAGQVARAGCLPGSG